MTLAHAIIINIIIGLSKQSLNVNGWQDKQIVGSRARVSFIFNST